MTQAVETVTLDLVLHRLTFGNRGALLVSRDGNPNRAVWLPKACVVEMHQVDRDWSGKVMRMRIVREMALEKGLISERNGDGPDLFDGGGA